VARDGYGVTLIDASALVVADAVALPGNTRVIHTDPRGVGTLAAARAFTSSRAAAAS
jgi:hypothetical protein